MAEQLEEPAYEVVESFKDFEIRKYASNIQACLKSDGTGDMVNRGSFRRIAGYIFGGNTNSQRIAMTAPVLMWHEDGGSMMSFVMPSAYALEDLPTPNDAGVELVVKAEDIVAVLSFSGFSRPSKVTRLTKRLQSMFEKEGWQQSGPACLAVYDPPTTLPFLRRNEIIIPIEKV